MGSNREKFNIAIAMFDLNPVMQRSAFALMAGSMSFIMIFKHSKILLLNQKNIYEGILSFPLNLKVVLCYISSERACLKIIARFQVLYKRESQISLYSLPF